MVRRSRFGLVVGRSRFFVGGWEIAFCDGLGDRVFGLVVGRSCFLWVIGRSCF